MVLASAFGGVRLMPEPLLLYRRHIQAVTGSRQGLRYLLTYIREATDERYRHEAILYANTAEYFRKIAVHRPGSQSNGHFPDVIKEAIQYFDFLSVRACERAGLYNENSTRRRLDIFIQLWRSGCYSGTGGIKGWDARTAVKDFLRVWLGGSR
jgi:hypothetical protein